MKRISLIGCILLSSVSLIAQTGAKNGEWRSYGADVGNTHYSALDQINASNFNKLEPAWHFKTDNLGPRPEFQYEGTPLMANGVLYATGGTRRAVFALDAATGELFWTHSEREGTRGANAPRQLSGRGLGYWTDGRDERILYVTPGYRLIALDAKTGTPVPGFGQNGVVDLKLDDDQEIDLVTGEVGLHSAPVVAKDVVVVGAAHRSGGVPRGKKNVKGYVRGFDVRTGKRLWIFHTIPLPNEYGAETWEGDSASYTGNTGVWGQISVDEELETVYMGVELPTGDYYGGHRPGNGLFGESLVAVDLHTGARFTPPVVSKVEGPLGTLVLGPAGGGTNWAGGSYDPETHILYVNSQSVMGSLGLVPGDQKISGDFAYVQGIATSGIRTRGGAGSDAGTDRAGAADENAGTSLTVQGLPLVKPPYGRSTAIDLNKGEILWQIAHGETPDNIRNHPALKARNIPRTGRSGIVGSLVTKTLVISGEPGVFTTPNGQRGAMLRAYDKATGKEVGAVYMPAGQTGTPMTYMLNGKQYIVVAIGGSGYSAELRAFRLPG